MTLNHAQAIYTRLRAAPLAAVHRFPVFGAKRRQHVIGAIADHLGMTKLGGPDLREQRRFLRQRWSEHVEQPAKIAGLQPPRLVLLEAQYRRIEGPLLQFVAQVERENRGRQVAVLIPEIVKERWWQYLLHGYRARGLRAALLRYGGSRVVVINVPWYLEEPHIEEGLEEEELLGADRKKAGGR